MMVNGRRHEESARTRVKAEARGLLKLREGDAAHGRQVIAPARQLTFDAAMAHVLDDYRMNGKRSLGHAERRVAKHLAPYFGGGKMAGITTADVTAYATARQAAGASNASINRELALLKRAFTLAVRGGLLQARPHLPMFAERNVRTGFFERDQFERVRAHLPEALRPVVTFAYLTGWRVPSEVLRLEWRQVDFAAGTVTLDAGTTKNNEPRTFVFAGLDELRELLEAQRDATKALQRERGIVVPRVFHRHGKPIRTF